MKPIVADYKTGMDAYERGDYVAAYKTWQPLAQQGNVDAQCMLGVLYISGWGVPQNSVEAARWFHRAGKQGDVTAQSFLGDMYDNGEGVPQDAVEATRWYRMAAEQGDFEAQYELSDRYANGKGVLQDDAKAEYWFDIASKPERAIIRECSTDAKRLLKAVGEEALRRGLPPSLINVLENGGETLTGEQVAEAAIATYHTDALREYRQALDQRLDPPKKRWAGSASAVDFVRSLGFSAEWAGERVRKPDPYVEVEGPYCLPSLHNYQKGASKNDSLAGEAGVNGPVASSGTENERWFARRFRVPTGAIALSKRVSATHPTAPFTVNPPSPDVASEPGNACCRRGS